VRRVEETKPSSLILVPPTLLDSEKSINSDLGPGSGDSITARLLASANAGGTASPKLSEMKTIIEQTKQDKISSAPAKRVKLTPEQREANKIAKAVVVAAAKAELRAAAVAAAAGETVPLPAVVFRGQQPRSVTMTEAAEIVRTATARAAGKCDVDIETSGYPIGHPLHVVRTVQLGDLMAAVVFDATNAAQIALAGELIAAAPRLGAFSATADLAPLAHAGLIDHESAWERMEDALIPATLADPAGTGSDAVDGLKALSGAVLGELAVSPAAEAAKDELAKAAGWTFSPKQGETAHERNGWAMVASDCATMVTYAASDVLDTAALAARLPDPGPELLARERALQRLVARVSYKGLAIDGALSARLLDEHQSASNIAAAAVRSYGIDNPASSQQVAAKLTSMGVQLPRTKPSKTYPQGQLSADKSALLKVQNLGVSGDLGVLVDHLLEFGSHKNAISTFLKPYVYYSTQGDGRIRPTIYTMEADTGRMSSVRPNVQNIPREGGFRAQIIADEGYLLIGADESGVELRVAAALSQDQHLIDIILADDAAKRLDPNAKTDIHWRIAQEVYGPDATKRQRYRTKNGVVFPRLYGSGIEGIARSLGMKENEVGAIVDVMDAMTPGLTKWSAQLRAAVKNGNTHFKSYSGRIIHLDPRYPHKAGNFAIQGTAREVIVDGGIRWSKTKWGKCVMWFVHDEMDAMVPAHEAIEATETMVDCMKMELFGVPILADPAKPSPFWADSV
jgi:DNA polymerase I-like protein with 3'-5' exonuclease and polymerase domains